MSSLKLNYDDITIVPERITDICSRSECNPYDEDGFLPIFASCMSSVVSIENTNDFNEAKIRTVIPRSYGVKDRLNFLFKDYDNFVAFSLAEAREYFLGKWSEELEIEAKIASRSADLFIQRVDSEVLKRKAALKVCIDLANGHMKCLIELVKELKEKYGGGMLVMTGNIANPETYREYEEAGVDYCRVSIGTGCFTGDMKVETSEGYKKISDVKIGDMVKTHNGVFERVTDTMEFYRDEKLYNIDGIKCTANHEFYVIDKKDENFVTEKNIKEYAFWVKAENLDKDKHLLIQL